MLCQHKDYIFWLLLCFLLWQRVVKADIVNYSQEPVTRTVNPPRSSMCAVQWPCYSSLFWYLWRFSYLDTGSGITRNCNSDHCKDAIRGFKKVLDHCTLRTSGQFFWLGNIQTWDHTLWKINIYILLNYI